MRYDRFESAKLLTHYDRLKDAGDRIVAPLYWMVYPTNQCNYQCGHCIMKEMKSGGERLSSDIMLNKIPSDAKQMGIKCVMFAGGGEPTLHPNLGASMAVLHNFGVKVGLITNGTTDLKWLSRDVDYLRISVDAGCEETHHKVHGVSAWDKVNATLGNLGHFKGDLGLTFLITPDNWQEVEQFCEWAQQYPYTFLHVRPAWLDGAYLEGGEFLKKKLEYFIAQKAELEAKYRGLHYSVEKFNGYWTKRQYTRCRAVNFKAVLSAKGSFILCQDVFKEFGDYNTQSFGEIWYGREHEKLIEQIDLDTCPRCVEVTANEIMEHCVCTDGLRRDLI